MELSRLSGRRSKCYKCGHVDYYTREEIDQVIIDEEYVYCKKCGRRMYYDNRLKGWLLVLLGGILGGIFLAILLSL